MANRTPTMPSLVLPRAEVMTKDPISALAEIRTSLGQTQANIEAALPSGAPGLPSGAPGAAAAGPKLPKIEEIFKGPAAALAEIQASFGLPGKVAARGAITEEKPPAPGGVATRGSL